MKMKRCLSLAVCAALLAALCACGSVSQDKLESVMDKYVADGNPQLGRNLAEPAKGKRLQPRVPLRKAGRPL